MASPFDIIKHICEKTHLAFELKEYAPWIVNKGLTNIKDTVYYAEAMNKYHGLDKDMQLAFYFHAIPKGKRFGKWVKASAINNTVDLIMRHYQVNRKVAEGYLKLMTDVAIKQLEQKMDTGGK